MPGDPSDKQSRQSEAAVRGGFIGCLDLPHGNSDVAEHAVLMPRGSKKLLLRPF
jgi:hypothetical protein